MTARLAPVIDIEEARAVRILRMEAGLEPDLAAAAIALDADWKLALLVNHGDTELAHLYALAQLCDDVVESACPAEAAVHLGAAAMAEIRRRVGG
jgi:hypothetical protein